MGQSSDKKRSKLSIILWITGAMLVEAVLVLYPFSIILTCTGLFSGSIITFVVFGLVFGLVGGLVVGLLFGLGGGLVVGLVDGLVSGLVGGLVDGLGVGLILGLGFGLSGGLVSDHFLRTKIRIRWKPPHTDQLRCIQIACIEPQRKEKHKTHIQHYKETHRPTEIKPFRSPWCEELLNNTKTAFAKFF